MSDTPVKSVVEDSQSYHRTHAAFADQAYGRDDLLPGRYVFILTNQCNLRCPFCFLHKHKLTDPMTAADWVRVIDQLPDYAIVVLTGGEPLLLPDFKDVFRHAAQKHDCSIISNGTRLTPEWVECLLAESRFKVLAVSIDSIGNTLRQVPPDVWCRTTEMMRLFALRKRKLNHRAVLEVKTVILDENAPDLLAIHRYCMEELQCDHHSFQFLKGAPLLSADVMHPFEDALQLAAAPVYRNFDTIMEQLEAVRRYNVQTGRMAFLHPKLLSLTDNDNAPLPDIKFVNAPDHDKCHYQPCKKPWASVYINADGVLFPCMAIDMGNVRTSNLAEIVQGGAMARFRRLVKEQGTVPGCNRCGYLLPAPKPLPV